MMIETQTLLERNLRTFLSTADLDGLTAIARALSHELSIRRYNGYEYAVMLYGKLAARQIMQQRGDREPIDLACGEPGCGVVRSRLDMLRLANGSWRCPEHAGDRAGDRGPDHVGQVGGQVDQVAPW